jgi:hypothetical protein
MIHQAQLMKISWAFLMAQGCGWLGAYILSTLNPGGAQKKHTGQ